MKLSCPVCFEVVAQLLLVRKSKKQISGCSISKEREYAKA